MTACGPERPPPEAVARLSETTWGLARRRRSNTCWSTQAPIARATSELTLRSSRSTRSPTERPLLPPDRRRAMASVVNSVANTVNSRNLPLMELSRRARSARSPILFQLVTAATLTDLALANRQHQRLEHLARRAVLHEGRNARVLGVRAREQRQGASLIDLRTFAEADRADPFTHHEIVLEPPAAVLAGGHVARELVLVGGQIHRRVFLLGRIDEHRGKLGGEGIGRDPPERERDPRACWPGIGAHH